MAHLEAANANPESPMEQDEAVFPCKGCGDILEEGKAFELAGNRWHIECFRCHQCGTLLDSDANLLLLGDGSLICNSCTYSCAVCKEKIEDLAILTGDNAYCSNCFKCRNCKKRIENLRYARTSAGIFCMECHNTLMARRRKRSKTSSAKPKEKALPSLPPGAALQSAFSPDVETPPSEANSETPNATPLERYPASRKDAPGSNSMRREASPLSDEVRQDAQMLPASTYSGRTPSNVSHDTDDGEERGYLPMAFDPTPPSGPPQVTRKPAPRTQEKQQERPQEISPPARNENRPRDYFGRLSAKPPHRDALREEQRPGSSRSISTEREREREPDRSGSQQKSSPHILTQEKGKRKKEASGNSTPVSANATATSPMSSQLGGQERSDRLRPDNGASTGESEGFKLQEVPRNKKAGSRSSSKRETKSPASLSPGVPSFEARGPDGADLRSKSQSPVSVDSQSSDVNPFDDPKRREGGAHSTPIPAKHADRPARGDSLNAAARKDKISTPEPVSKAGAESQHQPSQPRRSSASSAPSFVDAQSNVSRDTQSRTQQMESPSAVRSSFDVPPPRASSRPTAASKSAANAEFTAPRAPPQPPPGAPLDRHNRNNESISTMQSAEAKSDGQLSPTLRSAGLPKHSTDGGFSMEDEMSRIMRGEPKAGRQSGEGASMLRKVSNAVKHGRSFSDRGLHSAGKSSSNGPGELQSPVTISSPILASPSGRENFEQLAAQLRRAQQRIGELESDKNVLQEKLNSSGEIKAANNELREKRTTMVVLDTQREMVVRELESMTEHLSRAKDSSQPLDMSTLKSEISKEFARSLQTLKDQMSVQIEDLMHKRNQLTDEIGNLIQMKDKGFQEYETLSNKNAQLLEMNNQIMHNIQDVYKTNRVPNGSAHGLGIYQSSNKPETPGPSDVRNLNLVNTDSSMPNLLQETEAEPATVLTTPQVVDIRKAQPRKFNWRKGGEKMAKNVTKGIKGAFGPASREGEYGANIGMPYNTTHQAMGGSEQIQRPGMENKQGGAGFGFFSQKNGGLKPGPGTTNMKNNSSSNLPGANEPFVLFGSELEARCDYERRLLPTIVTRCIEEVESRGMDMEGIYRKSGGSGQVKQVQQLFETPSTSKDSVSTSSGTTPVPSTSAPDLSDEDLDIHAVTSALKQYFRKLPTPLITYDAYDSLLDAGRLTDAGRDKRLGALRVALAELPDRHRECLEYLVLHLMRVMAQESANLMTPLNLAVVFAPTIMRPLSIEREMSDMQAQRAAVQALLEFGGEAFEEL